MVWPLSQKQYLCTFGAIKNTNYLLLKLPSCVEVEFQNEIWAAVSAKFAKHCITLVLCINTSCIFCLNWQEIRRSIFPQMYWKCIIDGAFAFNFGFILFSDICYKMQCGLLEILRFHINFKKVLWKLAKTLSNFIFPFFVYCYLQLFLTYHRNLDVLDIHYLFKIFIVQMHC